ncbi:MFS transporter, UMF1 family [Epilithonimonas pallida]|uniref:MFS transporter, UMF1 family n=1 Tax=Epilithonimonas pallida TaxID=373671 RepID=A0ABY1R696_9FLAO|nr:MFS transporter, UMF1 family [Epilithonimonas pallida]
MPQFGNVKENLPKDLVLLNYKNIFKKHAEHGGFWEVFKDNVSFYVDIAKESFKELFKVGNKLFGDKNLKFFLSSFFFYSIGMQTIFLMATPFGSNVVFPKSDEKYKLIITILVIQVIAIFGAFLFSKLSKKIGNKNVITISVIIWVVCCLSAFSLNKENPNLQYQFYGLAGLIGLVMGGLQAMSRSTYSKLLPVDSMENTTYFSFYDVLEKIAIIFGMLIFSVFIQKFGNMQYAFIAMSAFFIVGAILIRFVKAKININ